MKTYSSGARAEPARAVPCALCGGVSFRPLWDLEGFSFRRCASCSLVQQNPQPEPGSVIARYSGDYLAYELENEGAFLSLALATLRDLGFEPASAAGLEFLDLGCATGALLERVRAAGLRARGVEPCAETSAYARKERGLDVFTGTLEEAGIADSSIDVLHASHVIEHMNDPGGFLEEARRVLKDSGRLFLTTPNSDGFQARAFGRAWRSAINDHLYLFSRRTLGELLARRGFRVRRWITWGGWARGAKPAFLKSPLDRWAKACGSGDVMAMEAVKDDSAR